MTTPRYLVGRSDEILFLEAGEGILFARTGNQLQLTADMSGLAYGSMYLYTLAGPGTTVPIVATDLFVRVPSGFSKGVTAQVVFQTARELRILVAGVYELTWVMSVECGNANQEIEGAVMVNGGAQIALASHIELTNSNRPAALGGTGFLSLQVGDLVSLCVLNHTAIHDLVVDHATLAIEREETGSNSGGGGGGGGALPTTDASALVSGTLADARLSSNVPLKNGNETIAGTWTFTPGVKERGRTAAMGDWTAVAFNAGNFTAGGAMTWTVAAGDQTAFTYTVIGHTMVVSFNIATSSVGGTPNIDLRIAIPGGYVADLALGTPFFYNDAGAGFTVGMASVAAGGTVISLYKAAFANWSASVDLTYVFGTFVFPIQ